MSLKIINKEVNILKRNCITYRFIFALLVSFGCHAKDDFTVPASLVKQVEQGNAEVAYFIATTFFEGSEKFASNYDKGLEWLKKAAQMGYAHAMEELAIEFESESKFEEALDWYMKAADLGMGSVLDRIAIYHYYGRAGLEKNCLAAYEWFEKAEQKEVELAYNNHAWFLATSADENCRNPERALKVISNLMALFDPEDLVPWHIWDTKAAVLASVSDFGAAISLQQWLIDEMEKVDEEVKPSYFKHLESYKKRKPWIETVEPNKNKSEG